MKKSKVIIPAMAMILFSTAASISGTVAWFTASRVFDTEVGEFVIKQLDGNLNAVVAPGIGTMKGAGNSIAVGEPATEGDTTADSTKPHYLVDASFNHNSNSGKIYKQNRDNTSVYDEYAAYGSAKDAAYSSDTAGWIYKSVPGATEGAVTKYYLAVTWTIAFSYKFNSETADVGVYLDFTTDTAASAPKSRFVAEKQDSSATGALDSKKGFRIAFVGGGRNVVWGDMANTADTTSQITVSNNTGYAYVLDNDETAFYTPAVAGHTSASATGDFIDANYTRGASYTQATNKSGQTNRLDRVATIQMGYVNGTENEAATTAKTGTTTVTCIAWYEGSDPNIQNGTIMESMHAFMSFYARSDA